uniref:hypothetical protein n=1 Tax=Candidatus Electrothrix sp. TaxID=2170559 RepID=UPI004056DA5F
MNKKYILFSIPVLMLIIGLAWYYSDKQVIKRQLNELTLNISKQAKESTLDTALKMGDVKQMLAQNVQAIVSERNYSESQPYEMIIRYLMYYRNRYETLSVSLTDLVIEFPEKGKATASLIVDVQRTQAGNEPEHLNEPVELLLKKNTEKKRGRKWLLVQASVTAPLVE